MRNARHLLKPFEKCDCQHSPGSKRLTSLYGRFVLIAQQMEIFGDGLRSGFKGYPIFQYHLSISLSATPSFQQCLKGLRYILLDIRKMVLYTHSVSPRRSPTDSGGIYIQQTPTKHFLHSSLKATFIFFIKGTVSPD
jgi:hypothetical protein